MITNPSFSKAELVSLLDAVLDVEERIEKRALELGADQCVIRGLDQKKVQQLKFKLIRLLEKLAVDAAKDYGPPTSLEEACETYLKEIDDPILKKILEEDQ